MRKSLFYIFSPFLAFGFLLSAFSSNAQQLKLGNNPTQINPSALLELESSNQGLLLTRIADTNLINNVTPPGPPDGMIIYFTDDDGVGIKGTNAGVYQRKDGAWQWIAQFFKVDKVPTGLNDISFTRSRDIVTLHLPNASETNSGIVSASAQYFGGEKHFMDSLIAESGFRANNAQVDANLILLQFKNTNSPSTDWFLSTDAGGKIFLQKIDDVFWKLGGNTVSPGTKDSLGTLSNTDLPIITNGQERMRITKDGKVGIGHFTNPNDISDTLTVNGSFKLGTGGSSFSKMAHATFSYTITADNDYDPQGFSISGVKKNAHVMINPQAPLKNGTTYAMISWVYADANGHITVCFKTTGSDNIGPVTFDVYYINPK